jgi:DNA (cytosine-5)-methyltransferase 1
LTSNSSSSQFYEVGATVTQTIIPEALLDLIARFERNRETYQAATYNETHIRREFIDPFFAALGWDVDNTQGFAEAYKDVIHEDAIKIAPSQIPSSTLATCSFPCIDLSLAGNMNGIDGQHSSAFWGFMKVLKSQGETAPPIVLVENVPGWLYSNRGSDFRATVLALNKLGYACDVFILDALRFTPQSRPRVFLVGTKLPSAESNQEGMFNILSRPKSLSSERLKRNIALNKELRWFYLDLPAPPPLRRDGLSNLVEPMKASDERWWSEEEVQRHLEVMSTEHLRRVRRLAEGNKISYRTFYRRRRAAGQRAEVRDDDLAGCLRTAIGGSGKQFLIAAGKGQIKMRAMTPREYARLQGVPEEYPIGVNGVQALTGFGDAVFIKFHEDFKLHETTK